MCTKRDNHERTYQVVNHRPVTYGNVCYSGGAVRNLSRIFATNKGKDELNATLLELRGLHTIAQERLGGPRVNGFFEYLPHSSVLQKLVNHMGCNAGGTLSITSNSGSRLGS